MRVLALDDNAARLRWFRRNFPGCTTVETAAGCIAEIEAAGSVDHLFLDHDLGDEVYVDSSLEETGMGVVRWIVVNRPAIESVTVHSMNTPAGNQMVAKLRDAGYQAIYFNFLRLVESRKTNLS